MKIYFRPFKDGTYGSHLHDDIVAAKYRQGESPPKAAGLGNSVGLSIYPQDNYKLDDKNQILTLSTSYQYNWLDGR